MLSGRYTRYTQTRWNALQYFPVTRRRAKQGVVRRGKAGGPRVDTTTMGCVAWQALCMANARYVEGIGTASVDHRRRDINLLQPARDLLVQGSLVVLKVSL